MRYVVVALLLAGCGGASQDAELPGNYAQVIESETDCAELQSVFDQAEQTGEARREAGDVDTARQYTAVMQAADAKMRQIGCY